MWLVKCKSKRQTAMYIAKERDEYSISWRLEILSWFGLSMSLPGAAARCRCTHQLTSQRGRRTREATRSFVQSGPLPCSATSGQGLHGI